MNYFSFFEIFLGAISIFAFGVFSAFLTGSLRLCVMSKDAFAAFFYQLYSNRSRLRNRGKLAFPEQRCNGRIGEFIIDFISVVILFLGYLLISYFFFDGIFRIIYLLPLFFGYFLFSRFVLPYYTRIFLFFLMHVLSLLSATLSFPIFLLYRLLFVLKLPILYIIHLARVCTMHIVSPISVHKWKAQIKKTCEDAMKIFNI